MTAKQWAVYSAVHKILQDRQKLGLPDLDTEDIKNKAQVLENICGIFKFEYNTTARRSMVLGTCCFEWVCTRCIWRCCRDNRHHKCTYCRAALDKDVYPSANVSDPPAEPSLPEEWRDPDQLTIHRILTRAAMDRYEVQHVLKKHGLPMLYEATHPTPIPPSSQVSTRPARVHDPVDHTDVGDQRGRSW